MKQDLAFLQEKVEKMLEGEKRRREMALKFVDKVAEILEPVAPDIWGSGEDPYFDGVVRVTKKKNDEIVQSGIYFRYKKHVADNYVEVPGFYYAPYDLLWGTSVEELRGSDFWYAVDVILKWIPRVIEMIEKREKGRAELLSKIIVED